MGPRSGGRLSVRSRGAWLTMCAAGKRHLAAGDAMSYRGGTVDCFHDSGRRAPAKGLAASSLAVQASMPDSRFLLPRTPSVTATYPTRHIAPGNRAQIALKHMHGIGQSSLGHPTCLAGLLPIQTSWRVTSTKTNDHMESGATIPTCTFLQNQGGLVDHLADKHAKRLQA